MSPYSQRQLQTDVDETHGISSSSSSEVPTQGESECDALQLLEAAGRVLADLSMPVSVKSSLDQQAQCFKKHPFLPSIHPVRPTHEKTVPSLKKKNAVLKPLKGCATLSLELPSPRKGKLEPLSVCKGFSFSMSNAEGTTLSLKKKKGIPELFSASHGVSVPSPSQETVPSLQKKKGMLEPSPTVHGLSQTFSPFTKKKKVMLEPLSACSANSLSTPCQGEPVPLLKKQKGKLEAISDFTTPVLSSLHKSPSLPSLKGSPLLSMEIPVHQRPQTVPDSEMQKQKVLGAQSLRGGVAKSDPFYMLSSNVHAKTCFQDLLMTEEKMCGEWAFLYHSYSTSALMYEVQAAIAAVLFGFRSQNGTLPRILMSDFAKFPDATVLKNSFKGLSVSREEDECHDGRQDYMAVGLSVMCSLLAYGPEASPTKDFCKGYADSWEGASWNPDLSEALRKLLETCCVPNFKIESLMKEIIALSEKHGLDVSLFDNGKECRSKQPGHLLQICIRRDIIDKVAYASLPYGHPDESRPSMSGFLDGKSSFDYGQARVLARPEFFMEPDAVRLHVVSADPTFHANRQKFQKELTDLLSSILGDTSSRESATKGICGGALPEGWTPDEHQSLRFSRPTPGARHCIKL